MQSNKITNQGSANCRPFFVKSLNCFFAFLEMFSFDGQLKKMSEEAALSPLASKVVAAAWVQQNNWKVLILHPAWLLSLVGHMEDG